MTPGLIRCLWRRHTLLNIAMLLGMSNALIMGVQFIAQGGEHSLFSNAYRLGYTSPAIITMAVICLSTGLGVLAAGAWGELLACPFSWFAKGMKHAILRDLVLLALLATALSLPIAFGLSVTENAAPRLGMIGIPSIAFSIGLLVFCSGQPVLLRSTAGATLLAALFTVEHLLHSCATHPVVFILAGLLVLVATVNLKSRPSLHRELVLGGKLAVRNTVTQHPFAPQPWGRALRAGKINDAPFPDRPAQPNHLHTIVFERWGWKTSALSRGPLHSLTSAVFGALVILVVAAITAPKIQPESAGVLEVFFALLWDPGLLPTQFLHAHSEMLFITPGLIFGLLLGLADRQQPALRHGHLYALSRSERADLIWGGGLRQWLVTLTAISAVLLATASIAALATESWPNWRPPYWLATALVAAAYLPLLQILASLSTLYPGTMMSPIQAVGTLIALACAFFLPAFLTCIAVAKMEAPGAWLLLCLMPVLAVVGQLLLRRYLHRRLAVVDLV